MIKIFNRLMSRAAKNITKAQQRQSKKLIKNLFAAAATAKPAKAVKSVKRAKKVVAKRVLMPRVSSDARTIDNVAVKIATKATPRTNGVAKKEVSASGKWLASYFNSFSDDGKLPSRRMNYWLYLPDNVPVKPMPLVIMLHGCEQSATMFSQGTRMNQLAEKNGFAVIYPQQSLRSHPNRCWPWYDLATQEGGGDVSMIVGIVNKVTRQYALDRSRIYIAGLSAGAAMANIIALNYPDLIAAVGLHSSPVFGAGHSAIGAFSVMQHGTSQVMGKVIHQLINRHATFPQMPAILIHGQADKVVRPINQAQLAQQFRSINRLGSDSVGTMVTKSGSRAGSVARRNPMTTIDYRIGRKTVVRVCEVLKLDHAWSGGDCDLKFNACAGPDASKMLWEFFAKHRRKLAT